MAEQPEATRWGIITGIYESFSLGEFGGSIEHFDRAVVLVIDDEIPDGGTFFGVDGVRDYMRRFLEPWQSLTITAETIEEIGDSFLVMVAQRATGRGSEAVTEMNYFQVWTFRGARVIRLESILASDKARALLRRPEPDYDIRAVFVDRVNRFSLEVDSRSGRTFVGIPVSNPYTDYTEWYAVDPETFERFRADSRQALPFVQQAKNRELDHLLLFQPGAIRGDSG